ncbi:carbon-nitrogen hydrolase family protein [Roseovarius sp. D22-M7]|uniref:carbon-nitrogen hydrolase family protein n=1 Tax=Roseovarius sp. D22-M7 TaxID=3127116 RepID=UPI0030101638
MGLTLGLWQGEGVPGDMPATVGAISGIARDAARRGADLLVFPEGYLTGYHLPGLAPGDLDGVEDALAEIGRIAAQTGLCIVMGTHLETDDGLRNAAVVVDRTGAELGRYHKRALYGAWEKATFRAGDAALRFACGDLSVGVAICYDVEFPEIIRAEARAGVDLVVVPTALMAPHDRVARLMVPVRAMENQVFLGYCNRTGHEGGLDFVGLSSIRGPEGEALVEAGAGPELLLARLDRSRRAETRAAFCYLDDLAGLRLR